MIFRFRPQAISSAAVLSLRHVTAVLLGAGASLLCFAPSAQAVETIRFRYNASEIAVTLDEIRSLANSGDIRQEVRDFFNLNRQEIQPIQDALRTRIRVPSELGQDFLQTSTGEFVLTQLDQLIQGSSDLASLRSTLEAAIDDDRNISILELLERYPESSVTLDLTSISRIYTQVSGFVERILPALNVAKSYLQDLVCDCDNPAQSTPTSPQSLSEPSALPVASASPCQTVQSASPAAPLEAATVPSPNPSER